MFYCYIIKIRDFYYVGVTENMKSRMDAHKSHCFNQKQNEWGKKLYRTIREYSSKEDWDLNVEKMILYQCEDEETIRIIEESYIKLLKEHYGDKCMNRQVKSTINRCPREKDENHEYKHNCKYCGYKTDNISNYKRHCNTDKYKKNQEEDDTLNI